MRGNKTHFQRVFTLFQLRLKYKKVLIWYGSEKVGKLMQLPFVDTSLRNWVPGRGASCRKKELRGQKVAVFGGPGTDDHSLSIE